MKFAVNCTSMVLVAVVGLLSVVSPVFAHHILGIPHYAYEEDYPQTPVLTYQVELGRYEIKMTGYPGIPQPGEPNSLHVYVREVGSGNLFDGTVRLTVFEDTLIGDDPVIYGPVDASLDERLYKFYPTFPSESDYLVRVFFEKDGTPWTIDLPVVVGEPGSPWTVVGGVGAAVLIFLVVVRAARIKMRRAADAEALRQPGSAGSRHA